MEASLLLWYLSHHIERFIAFIIYGRYPGFIEVARLKLGCINIDLNSLQEALSISRRISFYVSDNG